MLIVYEFIFDGLKEKSLINILINLLLNYFIYYYYLGLLIFLYFEIGIILRFFGGL